MLGRRALFGGTGRAFSLEVASFALTKKFSEAPEALSRAFSRDLAVFALELAPPSIPGMPRGSILEPGTAVFSRFFHAASAPCAKRPTSKKHCKNQYETHFGASAHRPKIDQKSIRQRFRLRLATRTASRASLELSRRLLERLWGSPGTLLDSSWPLLARPGRPQIGLGAALGRPKIVLSASRRVTETALGARTGPRSIFRRIFVDLGFIFVDFRAIFRRFLLEPPATKPQNQNLKKESREPHRTSWLLRCAVASYCSYVFRNAFRTLHVQPFFVAYPQAHLVSNK